MRPQICATQMSERVNACVGRLNIQSVRIYVHLFTAVNITRTSLHRPSIWFICKLHLKKVQESLISLYKPIINLHIVCETKKLDLTHKFCYESDSYILYPILNKNRGLQNLF